MARQVGGSDARVDWLGQLAGVSGCTADFEGDFHVAAGAAASPPVVQTLGSPSGGGDEVVVLSRSELEASRLRGEGAEGDGEVSSGGVRTIADGDDACVAVRDDTRVVLLL